jgi:outer membrane usher protein
MSSLAISAWSQTYWHSNSNDETVHLGFYSAWKGVSWGVGYYYTQSSDREKADRSWSFNLNIPLGGLAESAVSYSTTSDNNGRSSQQVAVRRGAWHANLDYSLQQGHANAGQGSNSSAALDYHGGYGSAQLGYRHDSASNQLTWGASGLGGGAPAWRHAWATRRRQFRHRPRAGGGGRGDSERTTCIPTGAAMPWYRP